jgi:hypothetical protein
MGALKLWATGGRRPPAGVGTQMSAVRVRGSSSGRHLPCGGPEVQAGRAAETEGATMIGGEPNRPIGSFG